MYQIEDIIRSLQFDINQVESAIISQYDQTDEVKMRIKKWYADLIQKMKSQDVENSGHLMELTEQIIDLQLFHSSLLTTYQDTIYQKLYDQAKPELIELVKRSGGVSLINEIDVAINGVYGLLVLKLKQQEISNDTQKAMDKITKMLAHLAQQFHLKQKGELKLKAVSIN